MFKVIKIYPTLETLSFLPFSEAVQTQQLCTLQRDFIRKKIVYTHPERHLNINIFTSLHSIDRVQSGEWLLKLATKIHVLVNDEDKRHIFNVLIEVATKDTVFLEMAMTRKL